MTYATRTNMIARFGESEVIALTDRSNYGEVDDAVLAGGLEQADAEINPYLQSKYVLPMVTVPTVIIGAACDIARYRLCGAAVTVTDDIRSRYKDAVKFLEMVANGKISLGLDTANNVAAPVSTVQFAPSTGRVFDRSNR